jgi:hypothetical protein
MRGVGVLVFDPARLEHARTIPTVDSPVRGVDLSWCCPSGISAKKWLDCCGMARLGTLGSVDSAAGCRVPSAGDDRKATRDLVGP